MEILHVLNSLVSILTCQIEQQGLFLNDNVPLLMFHNPRQQKFYI